MAKPNVKPPKGFSTSFGKIKEAREALRERTQEIIDAYIQNAMLAQEAGEFEVAAKTLQWLIEHMPADEDGGRVVDNSVDKAPKQDKKDSLPAIQIGFALGGLPAGTMPVKQLPAAAIIEGETEDNDVEG